jgi:hypothetical protein
VLVPIITSLPDEIPDEVMSVFHEVGAREAQKCLDRTPKRKLPKGWQYTLSRTRGQVRLQNGGIGPFPACYVGEYRVHLTGREKLELAS